MKKILYLLLFAGLLAHNEGYAQFLPGQRFISGEVGFDMNNYGKAQLLNHTYSHNLSVSWGEFKTDTRAVGWSLAQGLNIIKFRNITPEISPLGNVSLRVGRFVEYYMPLSNSLALYARPSAGLGYQYLHSIEVQRVLPDGSMPLSSQKWNHSVSLDVSLSAGVIWRFSNHWAIEGSVAGITPFTLQFGSGREEYYATTPGSQGDKVSGNAFNYSFRPSLNAGSIGLGFRYFY